MDVHFLLSLVLEYAYHVCFVQANAILQIYLFHLDEAQDHHDSA